MEENPALRLSHYSGYENFRIGRSRGTEVNKHTIILQKSNSVFELLEVETNVCLIVE